MTNIKFIHNNKANTNLILFIHGFTGDEETWRAPNKRSFPEMLCQDEEISSNFDIALVSYFTELFNFSTYKIPINSLLRAVKLPSKVINKNLGIMDLALILKSLINNYCSRYENIVIIAHSMGGVISKSYILDDLNSGSKKVKLFLSLAVPHFGVHWATIGKWLFKKNKQIIDLAACSSDLMKLSQQWIDEYNKIPHTVYFYGHNDQVVTKESAIGLQNKEQDVEFSSDDHFSITKPENEESFIYTAVKNRLVAFLSSKMSNDIPLDTTVELDEKLNQLTHSIKGFFNEEINKKSLEDSQTERPHLIIEFEEDLRPLYYPEFYNDINSLNDIKNFSCIPLLSDIFNINIKNIGSRYAKNINIQIEVNKEDVVVTDKNLFWMMLNPLEEIRSDGDKFIQNEAIAYIEKDGGKKLLPLNTKLNGILICSMYNVNNFLMIQNEGFEMTLDYFSKKSKERPLLLPTFKIILNYEDINDNAFINSYKFNFNGKYRELESHIGIKLQADFNI